MTHLLSLALLALTSTSLLLPSQAAQGPEDQSPSKGVTKRTGTANRGNVGHESPPKKLKLDSLTEDGSSVFVAREADGARRRLILEDDVDVKFNHDEVLEKFFNLNFSEDVYPAIAYLDRPVKATAQKPCFKKSQFKTSRFAKILNSSHDEFDYDVNLGDIDFVIGMQQQPVFTFDDPNWMDHEAS